MTAAKAEGAAKTVSEGDIVEVSYDMWVEGVEDLFDTTHADRARSSGIFDERTAYEPIVAVVGEGRLIAGLEEALIGATPGKEQEVQIPPEKGYGLRDPKLIETVPMREFKRQKVEPQLGSRIQYKGRPATVSRVDGRGVRLDLNSPLAGRKITYKFTVERVLASPEERIGALLKMVYPRKVAFEAAVKGKTVEIQVPRAVGADQQWIMAKLHLVHQVGKHTGLERVVFTEEHDAKALTEEMAERELEGRAAVGKARAAAKAAKGEGSSGSGEEELAPGDEGSEPGDSSGDLVEEEMLTDEDRL